MKTALSIPDEVYQEAETWIAKLRLTRSQFYVTAVERYVAELSTSELTGAMDRALAAEPEQPDTAMARQVAEAFRRVEW